MARHLLWLISALIFVGLAILIDSNSAQWVFLVRVQWVVLFGLTILPLLAHSFGRELLIGAYELNNRRAGFHDTDHYRCNSSFSLLQCLWTTIPTRPLLSPRCGIRFIGSSGLLSCSSL
jgi:hypothetical protein